MGLRADIQAALGEASVSSLSDVVQVFTLVKATEGAYNATTDTYGVTEVLHTSKGFFFSVGIEELADTSIKPSDEKVTVNGADISVPFAVDDEIRTTGKTYRVIRAKPIAGGETAPIVWSLVVRERGG